MATVRTETDARGVATLTLSRAEKRNALSGEMIRELHEATRTLDADEGVRAVILAAEGKAFCAGGDLNWMREQMGATAERRAAEAGALAEMLRALNEIGKPLIARVQGDAYGGGVGLMAVSDAVVAADDARFGLTETRLGLIPATIGPYVLARIGEVAARRWFYSARLFGAETAKEIGLVSRITVAEALDKAVEEEIAPYLATAPGAVREAKALALRLGRAPGEAEIRASIEALVRRWESAEAEEGTRAFFAKEQAPWVRS